MKLLGIDTGGTFTDLILLSAEKLHIHKVLSTPAAPEKAILQGIQELGLNTNEITSFIHGSTVATNAVLEEKGVKTAYISCRGFGDILTLGRQARPKLYQLAPDYITPPVPEALCLETGGRISCRGEVLDELTPQDISTLKQQLKELAPDAVAINLLFSFINNHFEHTIARALQEDYFVSCSSDLLSESREYERGIITWLNSYVGPLMRDYLNKLNKLLPTTRIRVMQSHGRTISAKKAGQQAVNLLLSGPAGGVIAAEQIASLCGYNKVLSFDMGGTSTDVAIIDNGITLTNEGHIGRYPICVPMIDIHTIGAGGSSIAYCDAGGLLRVGPESAGATPGPACYMQGGRQPTITDANLLLNRLPNQIGNNLELSFTAANNAFEPLLKQLAMSVEQVAQGVIDVVNEQMTQALRLMSAQKGKDPAEYLLIGFGAAGGLHICTLAENMQMHEAMVPVHAGVLSALGMLTSEQGLQKSQTLAINLQAADETTIQEIFQKLLTQAETEMREQDIKIISVKKFIDLRYQGQWHYLTFPYNSISVLAKEFHQAHEKLQGYQLDVPIELVTAKIQTISPAQIDMATALACSDATYSPISAPPPPSALNIQSAGKIQWIHRNALGEKIVHGPLLIVENIATTYVKEGWAAHLDSFRNLHLRLVT